MKLRLLCVLLILVLCGCATDIQNIATPEHTVMGKSISIPETASALAKAYYLSCDIIANIHIDKYFEKAPEFIDFQFSSDTKLSVAEREELKTLFGVYGCASIGDKAFSAEMCDKGIVIGFDSLTQHQVSDCDLTITIKIFFGRYAYRYCCDFVDDNNRYVLIRYEALDKIKHSF